MPPSRTWLPRTQEILTILRSSPEDTLDRAAIEKLFELQRRTALLLIHAVGPLLSGCSFVVDRKDVIEWVEGIWKKEGHEVERRRHVSEHLDTKMAEHKATQRALRDAGKTPVPFPVVREILAATVAGLPPSIQLSAGRIVLEFDPEDARAGCQLLYQLGLAIANDYDAYSDAVQDVRRAVCTDNCITEPI